MARSSAVPSSSRFLTLASICVVVAALYLAREVLIPLALAVLLTFLIAPLVTRLERLGLRRIFAVILVVIASLAMVALFGWLVAGQLRQLVDQFPKYKSTITIKAHTVQDDLATLLRARKTINELTQEATSQPSTQPAGAAPPLGTPDNPTAVSIVANAVAGNSIFDTAENALSYLTPLGDALVVVVFMIFMLSQREDLRDRVIRLAGSRRLTVTTQAIDEAANRVSTYLLYQSMVNGTLAAAVTLGLFLLHVPNPILWGLLCGVLRFIPYVGIWIGASFPIVLSLVLPGWLRPLMVLGMFLGLETITGNFIEPYLYGASTGVSSIAILVAAVFWTWLWGVVGLLLSTPMTVCLVVMGKYVPHLEFLNVLLGDEPVLKPSERLYQRLLASDGKEALELLRELLKTQRIGYAYENVLLPALAMAQRDYAAGNVDEDHYQALGARFREVLEEVKKVEPAEIVSREAQRVVDVARTGTSELPKARLPLPKDCVVNVVCTPAHGEADAIGAEMLSHVLGARGFCCKSIGADLLANEVLDQVQQSDAHVVVISAFPPHVLAPARYLVKKLRTRFPDKKIVVGVWDFRGDLSRLRPRIGRRPAVEVVTNFSQAQDRIEQIIQPVLLQTKVEAVTK